MGMIDINDINYVIDSTDGIGEVVTLTTSWPPPDKDPVWGTDSGERIETGEQVDASIQVMGVSDRQVVEGLLNEGDAIGFFKASADPTVTGEVIKKVTCLAGTFEVSKFFPEVEGGEIKFYETHLKKIL